MATAVAPAFAGGAGESVRLEASVPGNPTDAPPFVNPVTAAPPLVALAYPKAGFWERMAAAFLDIVLMLILSIWIGPLVVIAALAYFAAMWAWKGTTIGGIDSQTPGRAARWRSAFTLGRHCPRLSRGVCGGGLLPRILLDSN